MFLLHPINFFIYKLYRYIKDVLVKCHDFVSIYVITTKASGVMSLDTRLLTKFA